MSSSDDDGGESIDNNNIHNDHIRKDIQTLASSRCDYWSRKARLNLQERILETLQLQQHADDEAESNNDMTSLLLGIDITHSTSLAAARLVPLYVECLKQSDNTKELARVLLYLLGHAQSTPLVRKTAATLNNNNSTPMDWYDFVVQGDSSNQSKMVAVALGYYSNNSKSTADWISTLLEMTLTEFPTNLDLVQDVIKSTSSDSKLMESASSALLGKTKSHTSKALPTVTAWISYLTEAGSDTVALELTEDWQAHVCKNLVAPKDSTRLEFRDLVLAWRQQPNNPSINWAQAIVKHLPATTTLSPPARLDVYKLFHCLASVASNKRSTNNSDDGNASETAAAVLVMLEPLVDKEKSDTARVLGIQALLSWVVRLPRTDRSESKSLQIVRKSWTTSKPTVDTCAGPIMSLLLNEYLATDSVSAGLVEGLVPPVSKKDSSLSAWATAAGTKKTLLTEGVTAIYLTLLACQARKEEVPAWVHQALKPPSSFVYGVTNSSNADKVPLMRTLALYVQLESQREKESFGDVFKGDAAKKAVAACLATTKPDVESLKVILLYRPLIVKSLAQALERQVAADCETHTQAVLAINASRAARETETNVKAPSFSHCGIRQAALLICGKLPESPTVWRLMHVGTSLRHTCRQRRALVKQMITSVLSNGDATRVGEFADDLANRCSNSFWQSATTSLLTTMGTIGGLIEEDDEEDGEGADFSQAATDMARQLCLAIGSRLSTRLTGSLKEVLSLTDEQIGVYRSPAGTLFEKPMESSLHQPKRNKNLTEDEAWELEMKKELAKKSESKATELTSEQKSMVASQDKERVVLKATISEFVQVLDTIRCLVSSDIEIGNDCLADLAKPVLAAAVARCPAMSLSFIYRATSITLTGLASAVYEIDERYAPNLSLALASSCQSNKDGITTVALPSPCPEAACVISEIWEYGDALSSGSFLFLFPVIQAAIKGPRSTPGCEDVIKVIERHTELLTTDPIVAPLRKDIIASLLDLLQHDRSQVFHKPTAVEALVACCSTEGSAILSQAEMAPLLDVRGALGTKSSRRASMLALAQVASENPKTVKSNPLVENRVWLNCFEKDDEVRVAAHEVWKNVHGLETVDENTLPPPSALYAAPLLPLLHSKDMTIAVAAAASFAKALVLHPASVSRNMENLCKTYIDAFPTSDAAANLPEARAPKAAVSAPIKKKTISTGLPKKKPKKSALSVAGIGKPKTMKKKAVSSALLKPKQERTLDQSELEKQFKGTSSTRKEEEEKDSPERIATRLGVLRAIAASSSGNAKLDIDEATLKQLTSFLMAYGIADSDDGVKGAARNALRDVVAANGGTDVAIAFLLPHLESVLKTGVADEGSLGSLSVNKIPRDVAASDRRKEGAVVALGSVAIHLKGDENATKVDNTIDMLLSALKTPSEDVQSSVADALTKLMKKGNTQARSEQILAALLDDCLHGTSLARRRGAAYGIAAAIKGSGIAALKKYEIVRKLEEACSDGDSSSKEGSLFAIELLCGRLGLLFEPYVIVLLPSLLRSFSDSSDHVRTAASHTAGLIMSKLSAHGVKLVMPAVLKSFEDSAWRTKQASIHMLGSMSHLAPKQLASALPKVVPRLTEAFSDTHPKVKQSAQEALHEISTVVRNPEISSISSILLKALTDPADYTVNALEGLIETEFLHAIDAPSLALIVPILHRGLRDRGASTKRYGGLIAGNICTMINDEKDFVPYLPTLLPDLQLCLLDPIPDVRSTSAKALGSLARSLGDYIVPELRPWLLNKLREVDCSSAERSGAAQGLTEVLVASGSEVVDDAMRNEILPLRSYPEASTREGVLWMLTFLPPSMGQGFTPLIDVSLPALISGLSDDSEPVRDVAMRAGRVLIRTHGKVHVDKILPSLESGLIDEDYRIRLSSLSLLGDLLSTLGGTTMVKGDGDTQDDIRRAERAQAQIAIALGPDTRRRVYSSLYFARSDNTHAVRLRAIQVWKTIVSVTARTLRDILPVLVNHIIDNLASGDEERTEIAGKCLGDVVSKLGDSVLPQIMPVLKNSLTDGDSHTKRGVCVGLTDIIKCSTKEQIIRFLDVIVRVVQEALSDADEDVRQMAATSFQCLYSTVGNRAFDEVVPSLMVALDSEDEKDTKRLQALNGLTGILSIRSRELLPYIIPRLIQRPISKHHATALAKIADVTGDTIYSHFSTIIPALLHELAEFEDNEAVRGCVGAMCSAVGEGGVNVLVSESISSCGSDKAALRRESCRTIEAIIVQRAEKQDFFEQIPVLLRELLYRLNDDEPTVLKAANAAFSALSKHVAAEELVNHIEFIRNLLASMVSDSRRRKGGVGDGEFLLPGFSMPKGVEPLVPIYQRGILYGSPNIREVSAAGLGEILAITPNKFLAGPLIIKMTGPLLRVVGDRNPSNVKIAILKTLGLILTKGGPALRAFVPQFQTTFVKALSDPSRQVRVEAIKALSLLMPLSTRVDPLIKELVAGSTGKSLTVEGAGAAAVQTATLQALAIVLQKGGSKAKLPTSVPSAMEASQELLDAADEGIREAAAGALGQACYLLGTEETSAILSNLGSKLDSSSTRHGAACAIWHILASPAGENVSDVAALLSIVTNLLDDENITVRESACVALGAVLGRSINTREAFAKNEATINKLLEKGESMEIHQSVARGLCVALQLIEPENRIETMGTSLIDSCLQQALSGTQRVQFAFNDVLWLALDVPAGLKGLEAYSKKAVFDNQRKMTSLHSKVLSKIKRVSVLDN